MTCVRSEGSPGFVRQKVKTYKEEASAKGTSYLWNGIMLVVIPALEPFLQQSFPSVRMNGKGEKKGGDAHLHMSLAESPLYLILLSNVEMGLEGGER